MQAPAALTASAFAPLLLIGCLFTTCGGYDRDLQWDQALPPAVLHRAEGLPDLPKPDESRPSALWSLHFVPADAGLRYGARWNDTEVTLLRTVEDATWGNRSNLSADDALPPAIWFIENLTGLDRDDAEAFARSWIHGPESFQMARPHGQVPLDRALLLSLPWTTAEVPLSHGLEEEDRPVAGEWLAVWDVTVERSIDALHAASIMVGEIDVVVYEEDGRAHASVEGPDMSLSEAKEAVRQAFAAWELPGPTFARLDEHETCSW